MSQSDEDDEPPVHPKRAANPSAKRPEACKKDYDKLVKAAWQAKWWCYTRSNGYIVCQPPDAEGFVNVPCTPSKQGTLNQTTRKFRKLGLDV